MSLTASLNSAMSGLTQTSRRAEAVASNVANADTDGYRRREIVQGEIPGRAVTRRVVDPALAQLRRDAAADAAREGTAEAFHARLDTAIGDPGDPGSVQARLAAFDASLVAAASDPTSETLLASVARDAASLAGGLNDMADVVTAARQDADAAIDATVRALNSDLSAVADLNTRIMRVEASGQDASDLRDRRGLLVDRISEAIPVRRLVRDGGVVALVSTGGAILLDGRAAAIGFTPQPVVTDDMVAPGQLSGLTIRGRPIVTGGAGPVSGGRLGALFDIRDRDAPAATDRLDAFAADLIDRFARVGTDPSLTPGDPGLFTDAGAALSAAPPAGLAARLRVNNALEPTDPATLLPLRDGFGAMVAGPAGDPAQLLRFGAALHLRDVPVTDPARSAGSLVDLLGTMRSEISSNRVRSEDAGGVARAHADSLAAARDGGSVDTDAEMRRLIEIERAYAANARVIQAVGAMMDRITEI